MKTRYNQVIYIYYQIIKNDNEKFNSTLTLLKIYFI